ncbi:unnamed protein product [Microthlaspi erraticum]|uniref:Translation elongation factor EF1B beta/delta subunit guanine nucleotide exchange domain-containing protein n=1 Tax=Microthlaspi erraticum TaxID=1685480 RepID=A0A6D2IM15_9BRAS|nr:unnamed protein product [Microthlaspi erraticum]
MAAFFPNLNSDAGLKKLDEHLLNHYYISSHEASKDDATVYEALTKPPPPQYVNASRWYNHIETLLSISGIPCVTIPEEDDSDDDENDELTPEEVDSDDDEDDDLIMEEAEERAAFRKSSRKKEKSWESGVIVIIPNEAETNMKMLEKKIRSIKMKRLIWGPSKLVPIGYGLELLRIIATAPEEEFDEKIDDLADHILNFGDFRIATNGVRESLLLLKPNEDEADMQKLEEAVRSIQASGFFWGESRLYSEGCGSMLLGIECTAVGCLFRSGHTVRFEEIVREEVIGHRYVQRQSCRTRDLNRLWSGITSEEESDPNGDLLGEERASSMRKESGKSGLLLVALSPSYPDIKKLDESLRSIQREGLVWENSKTVDAGYGITYLGIGFTNVGDQASLNTAIKKFDGVVIPLTHNM